MTKHRLPTRLLAPVLSLLLVLSMVGCSSQQIAASGPIITTAVADAGTVAALQSIKDPVSRLQASQITYDAAAAVFAASGTNPDYAAAQKLITDSLAKWNSPYQPIVTAVVTQLLQNAKLNASATPTAQQTQAAAVIQNAMLGVELAALSQGAVPAAITPPTTLP